MVRVCGRPLGFDETHPKDLGEAAVLSHPAQCCPAGVGVSGTLRSPEIRSTLSPLGPQQEVVFPPLFGCFFFLSHPIVCKGSWHFPCAQLLRKEGSININC